MLKTAQLFDYASKRLALNSVGADLRQQTVQSRVLESLRAFFTKARETTGQGRPPKKLGQAVQAVLTAIARAPELGSVSLAAVWQTPST